MESPVNFYHHLRKIKSNWQGSVVRIREVIAILFNRDKRAETRSDKF
jgi:hypothetical protein